LLKRIGELGKLFRMIARVHDKEEGRRSHLRDRGKFILACGILRDEFGR
jgi:hypothetical protein